MHNLSLEASEDLKLKMVPSTPNWDIRRNTITRVFDWVQYLEGIYCLPC